MDTTSIHVHVMRLPVPLRDQFHDQAQNYAKLVGLSDMIENNALESEHVVIIRYTRRASASAPASSRLSQMH